MTYKPLTIFLVLSAVDLGYEVLTAHFSKIAALNEVARLKEAYPYPNMPCEQYIVQEVIVE